jgi:HK97 family phage portal protein
MLNSPSIWVREVALSPRTASGESVTPDRALALPTYWACLNNLSQDVAKLPFQVRRWRDGRGSDEATDHPLSVLLRRRPNPLMGSMVFRQTLQHRRLGWGNGYAEIVRNEAGAIVQLWPVHPLRITPKLQEDGRTLVYEYRPDGITKVTEMEPRELLHIRGMGSGLEGLSALRLMSESLGLGLAAQRHAAAFYGEGAAKRMVAISKQVLSPKGREEYRKRLKGDQDNDPVGQRKLPFLEGDITLQEVGIHPDEAQFLESRQFQVPEVARWFRMNLSKIQHEGAAKGWNTVEAQNRDYATDALVPLATEWEEECWLKLLSEQEQNAGLLYFKHVFQALLRADYTARWAGYVQGLQNAVLSPNDVRELEDMNPITLPNGEPDPAGDVYRTQMQNAPIGQAPEQAEPVAMTVQAEPAGGAGDAVAQPDPMAAMRPVFEDAARRVVRKECEAMRQAVAAHAKDPLALELWARDFYGGHETRAAVAFAAPCSVLVALLPASARPAPAAAIVGVVRGLGRITLATTEESRVADLTDGVMALVLP